MARLIRHEETGPCRIDPQEQPIFICRCGLTQNPPFCDGAHAACRNEQPGVLYIYNRARNTILDTRPDDA